MKINIRPIILLLSGLHVLFLFFPIFPIRSGWGIENKSIVNFIFGVQPSVIASDLFAVGRGLSIFTALVVVCMFILCFRKTTEIERSIPLSVFFQLVCMGFWIAVMAKSYLNTAGVGNALRKSFGLSGSYHASLFWPKFVLVIDLLNILAFISLKSTRVFIDELSLSGIMNFYQENSCSFWICKKCNASNDLSSFYCNNCGAGKDGSLLSEDKSNCIETESIEKKTAGFDEEKNDSLDSTKELNVVYCHKCGAPGESGGYCCRCGAKLLF